MIVWILIIISGILACTNIYTFILLKSASRLRKWNKGDVYPIIVKKRIIQFDALLDNDKIKWIFTSPKDVDYCFKLLKTFKFSHLLSSEVKRIHHWVPGLIQQRINYGFEHFIVIIHASDGVQVVIVIDRREDNIRMPVDMNIIQEKLNFHMFKSVILLSPECTNISSLIHQ